MSTELAANPGPCASCQPLSCAEFAAQLGTAKPLIVSVRGPCLEGLVFPVIPTLGYNWSISGALLLAKPICDPTGPDRAVYGQFSFTSSPCRWEAQFTYASVLYGMISVAASPADVVLYSADPIFMDMTVIVTSVSSDGDCQCHIGQPMQLSISEQ